VSVNNRRKINIHDLQSELAQTVDVLEERLEGYAAVSGRLAEAEHAWKHAHATTLVRIADEGGRTSIDIREAQALVEHADLHRTYRLVKEESNIALEGLRMERARMEAVRTLIASERALLT